MFMYAPVYESRLIVDSHRLSFVGENKGKATSEIFQALNILVHCENKQFNNSNI